MTNSSATEAMLLKWNASPNGATITLLLPDESVLEQFKSMKVGRVNGQRLGVAFAVINDDETQTVMADAPNREAGDEIGKSTAEHKGFTSAAKSKRELTLPQRVAMMCQDENFKDYLVCRYPEWASGSKDIWAEPQDTFDKFVRQLCGVNSRSEIMPGTPAADKWRNLYYEFERCKNENK